MSAGVVPDDGRFSPLVIGGTGGSGTRVVAQIVRHGGRDMGSELNCSLDAMPLARFDWSHGLALLRAGDGRAHAEVECAFADAVSEHLRVVAAGRPWGWKAPHSYLLLPFLSARCPELRFVHVVRDGRDMALSRNQNQARHYGDLVLGPGEWTPDRSLRFWAWANLRAERQGRELLGNRYLLMRIEDLWEDPRRECERLLTFGSADGEATTLAGATSVVVGPGSAGRWRQSNLSVLTNPPQVCEKALAHFGYLS